MGNRERRTLTRTVLRAAQRVVVNWKAGVKVAHDIAKMEMALLKLKEGEDGTDSIRELDEQSGLA